VCVERQPDVLWGYAVDVPGVALLPVVARQQLCSLLWQLATAWAFAFASRLSSLIVVVGGLAQKQITNKKAPLKVFAHLVCAMKGQRYKIY
jgi:hypothetical protein